MRTPFSRKQRISDLDHIEFFTKNQAGKSSYDYKFHTTALGDPSIIACNKLDMADCSSVGNVFAGSLSLLQSLCKSQAGHL